MRFFQRLNGEILLLLAGLGFLSFKTVANPQLVISEVMSSNRVTLADEDGDYPDWAEIRNVGSSPVSLAGYGLSDDPALPHRWVFPDQILEPNDVLVVFCSGKDRTTPGLAASAGEWEPAKAAGLRLWFDAQQPSSLLLDGNKVVLWTDSSGQESHASQVETNRLPSYGLIQPRQLPAVFFDGIDDFLSFPEQSQIRTVFWVGFESPFASNSGRAFLGHDQHFDFHRGFDRTLFSFKHTQSIQQGVTAINDVVVDPWQARFPNALSLVSLASAGNLRVNLLGSDRRLTDRVWQGAVGELVLFDRAFSVEELDAARRYFSHKWHLPSSYLHTNFRLEAGRETVGIYDRAENLVDSVTLPPVKPDVSIGRPTSGGFDVEVYELPTPGLANESPGLLGVTQEAAVSLPPGSYRQPIEVVVSHPEPNAVVRFTTDGTRPTESSPAIPSPIEIRGTTSLRLVSFLEGYLPSEGVVLTYLIDGPSTIPQIALTTDPANLVSQESGIYVLGTEAQAALPHFGANYWRDWERPATVEVFGVDGHQQLNQAVGLKIHGGWSRAAPQKSMALIARDRYGKDRLRLPVFGQKDISEFKQWLLRSSGNDWVRTLFRDALGQEIAGELGLDHQAYQPVHVYLNGEYWGIHNLRERLNEHFIRENHQLKRGQFDFLESDRSVISGSVESFDDFLTFLSTTSPQRDDFLRGLVARLDVDAFFNYLALQFYIDNTDWPGNNVRYWKTRSPSGRWRWLPFDLDGGFGIRHTGSDRDLMASVIGDGTPDFRPSWLQYITRRLLQHPDLKRQFVQRMEDLLNTRFATSEVMRRIETFAARLRPEIDRHIERWGGSPSLSFVSFDSLESWEGNVAIMKEFVQQRPNIVREQLRRLFQLNPSVALSVTLPAGERGEISVNGWSLAGLSGTWEGHYSLGSNVFLEAKAKPGFRFAGWEDLPAGEATRQIVVSEAARFTPRFEAAPAGETDPVAYRLKDRPFVFHSYFSNAIPEVSRFMRLYGRRHPNNQDVPSGLWPFDESYSMGSRFMALGRDGIGLVNTDRAQPGREAGYVDSVGVVLDTTGVGSGTLSWRAEQVGGGERPFVLLPQFRTAPDLPFQALPGLDSEEVAYVPEVQSGKEQRFQGIPLPPELLDRGWVELRWFYQALPPPNVLQLPPEIRLDDIVIVADGQTLSQVDSELVINEIMYHPPTRDPLDEYIEIYNRGEQPVELAGWRLRGGVEFDFSEGVLGAGEWIVIAASRDQFQERFPEVHSVAGDWRGRLSNSAESIELENPRGERVDRVEYADEGDWNIRVRGELDRGYRGWTWSNGHDGGGHSLELVAPSLSNNQGLNWEASEAAWGTPGQRNSVFQEDGPPVLSRVRHSPVFPGEDDLVTIQARVRDEVRENVSVRVWYRVGEESEFVSEVMWDDGLHGDEAANDGLYGVRLPPQPDGSIVAFLIRATDAAGQSRTWPRFEAETLEEAPLALFQVRAQSSPTTHPRLQVILSEQELRELREIDSLFWNVSSDAQMNGTFVGQQGAETEVRYLVGVRLRGSTSRNAPVKNRRINLRSDEPWKGRRAVILNAVNVPSQILGSLLFRQAGVPASPARPVQFLENGVNRADPAGRQFGLYAEFEALDAAFVANRFPGDPEGNLYRPSGFGNLEYLGSDPAAYQAPGFYRKVNNVERDEWDDLIELTRRLEESSDEGYVASVGELADLDRWVSYFAADSLLANLETSFANGGAGDYALYLGKEPGNSFLIAYDLDSNWLPGLGAAQVDLFRAAQNPVPNRFLKHPEIARRYHQRLRELAGTLFEPARLGARIDAALEDWVSAEEIARIKSLASTRRDIVLARSHRPFQVEVDRPFAEPAWLRYYLETSPDLNLTGQMDPLEVDSVHVNGVRADLTVWSGEWQVAGVPLHHGVNQIRVAARHEGRLVEERIFNVYRPGEGHVISATELAEDVVWTAEQSPIVVNQNLTIAAGQTLTIEPGTSVEFNQGARLIVEGRLLARGTEDQRIYLSRNRNETTRWGGILFSGGNEISELHYVTIEWSVAPTIEANDTAVTLEGLRWVGTFDSYIVTRRSSMSLKDSILPDSIDGEPVTGFSVPEGGFYILEGNEFGNTASGGDIVDFSGGRRPDTWLQIYDNVFHGGPDDGLDLDGSTALLDGNLFMNFRKANSGTGDAHAVSTGVYEGQVSDLVLVRNVFVDNEHALLMKEGAVAVLENNTFVRSLLGTISFAELERRTFPPDSITIRDSIVWDSPLYRNLDFAVSVNPDLAPRLENSMVFPADSALPDDALVMNPLFRDEQNDFRLQRDSPARGAGTDGRDLGAFVPGGVRLGPVPPLVTSRRSAVVEVTGLALTRYRFRLNDSPYSDPLPIGEPIVLSDLSPGEYQLEVIGQNVAGRWQQEPTVSQTWIVNPALPAVRINEVLAHNVSAYDLEGEFPDYIELHNAGDEPFDLSRMQLSDDLERPNRFVFPNETVLAPGEFIVVHADGRTELPGFHAAFRIGREGGGIYLRDRFSRGETVIDSVEFGRQLSDVALAVGRRGAWSLGEPTPWSENRLLEMGEPSGMRISEWLAAPGDGAADFVELVNTGAYPVDIGGMALSPESTTGWFPWQFPALSFLDANGYLVLSADPDLHTGAEALRFRLPDESGMIGLLGREGQVVDQVTYAYQRPGVSWERVPDGGDRFWPSERSSPGRGALSIQLSDGVVINEVVADNRFEPGERGTFPDWIELYNAKNHAVSLAGYSLTDDLDDPSRWEFSADAAIDAESYLVITFDSNSPPSASNTGFGLKFDGDSVFLLTPAAAGHTIVDQVTYGLLPPGWSLGRRGETSEWGLTEWTPGALNAPAVMGEVEALRINEWMAQPQRGEDWFELVNTGERPVDLSGLFLTDDPTEIDQHQVAALSFIGVGAFGFTAFQADGAPGRGTSHVDFKLSGGGEAIALYGADGRRLDEVQFGPQQRGVSEGRLPDGGDEVVRFPVYATRGSENFLDRDNDGQLDRWERELGLDPTDASDAAFDIDDDGVANRDEVWAGTNPLEATSRFLIQGISVGGEGVVIRFRGESGRAYDIQAISDVSSGEWESIRQIKRLALSLDLEVNLGEFEQPRFLRITVR